ncbi:MAG: transcriptional regulator, IclR family [Marmoricola sp.]|nr:transcriptional regulator, IclR family [Marmoricola sp.]
MAGKTGVPGTGVTGRVFAVLGAFDAGHRMLTLSEIATRAGLPVSTTHRFTTELVSLGALHRDSEGRFAIGRRLWDLGLLSPVQTGLRETASPYLHDVYGATLATVHIAVRDHENVLYIDAVRGNMSVLIASTIGSRLPLHCTGVGKVLLAHAPGRVVQQVLAGPLERVTPYTITQPARLQRELARVRRDGYATTDQEMTLGACSAAVPIAADGRVIAAIGVVVPSLRRTRARMVASLEVAARGISRSLERR